MPVKMLPTNVIKARLGIDSNGRVIKFFASEGAKKMDKFVPMREGVLRQYKKENTTIVYDTPYARYIYNGISKSGKPLNYSKDMHPFATDHWDKKMWSAEGQDLVRLVQRKFGGK